MAIVLAILVAILVPVVVGVIVMERAQHRAKLELVQRKLRAREDAASRPDPAVQSEDDAAQQ